MKPEHLPNIEPKYWFLLCIASIFGANTGDFFSDILGYGHIAGLPALLGIFIVILITERFDNFQHHLYFWLAIIVTRTAATNIGDIGHDLHVSGLIVICILALALIVTLFTWKKRTQNIEFSFATHPVYWWTMLLAGALGTAIGDYFSFGLGLGNLNATFILSFIVAGLFYAGRNGKLTEFAYYWLIVIWIRSAGTAAGDFFAHHVFGLELSTAIFGGIFILLLTYLYKIPTSHKIPKHS